MACIHFVTEDDIPIVTEDDFYLVTEDSTCFNIPSQSRKIKAEITVTPRIVVSGIKLSPEHPGE